MVYGMEIFRGIGVIVFVDKDVFEKYLILRWVIDINLQGRK